jgi:hypothetical protein
VSPITRYGITFFNTWSSGVVIGLCGGSPGNVPGFSYGETIGRACVVGSAYVIVGTPFAAGESAELQLWRGRAGALVAPVTNASAKIDSSTQRGATVYLPVDSLQSPITPGDYLSVVVSDYTPGGAPAAPTDWSVYAEVP